MKSIGFFFLFLFFFTGCSDETVAMKESSVLACPNSETIHDGEATFYTFASGAGTCMFDSTPGDLMVTAMNTEDFAGSQICGAYIKVTGPSGTVNVRVVDLCPGCKKGDLDLSPQAFAKIADTSLGRVKVTWQIQPYNVTGPIQYHFKDGSNQWWTAVQIRNHRYPIYSVEYLTSQKSYKEMVRQSYNYFLESSGAGPGPFTFRVTDIYGHVVVDSSIIHVADSTITGNSQFPLCQ